MYVNNEWDSIESFLLKECYDLAARYESQDIVRNILREKCQRINIPDGYVPLQGNTPYQETEMQILSQAVYELTLEGYATDVNSEFQYIHKINGLPTSAEKEYLLAILSLRKGTNTSARIEALRHISSALALSPNDPRYTTLASILQEVDK